MDLDLGGVTLFCAAGVNWLVSLYARTGFDVGIVAAQTDDDRRPG